MAAIHPRGIPIVCRSSCNVCRRGESHWQNSPFTYCCPMPFAFHPQAEFSIDAISYCSMIPRPWCRRSDVSLGICGQNSSNWANKFPACGSTAFSIVYWFTRWQTWTIYSNGILKNPTSKRPRFCFAFRFCCWTLYTYKGTKSGWNIPKI